MIIGVGIDVVDIERFGQTLERHARRCASGCSPRRSAASGIASLAARFAAKEALAKSLGAPVGLHWTRRHRRARTPTGARRLADVRHRARRAPTTSASTSFHLSLSHDAGIASAVVIAEGWDVIEALRRRRRPRRRGTPPWPACPRAS